MAWTGCVLCFLFFPFLDAIYKWRQTHFWSKSILYAFFGHVWQQAVSHAICDEPNVPSCEKSELQHSRHSMENRPVLVPSSGEGSIVVICRKGHARQPDD